MSLVPDLKLIATLEKEIERERALLETEQQQLETLTKNAAREEASRKSQMKKVPCTIEQGLTGDARIVERELLVQEPCRRD